MLHATRSTTLNIDLPKPSSALCQAFDKILSSLKKRLLFMTVVQTSSTMIYHFNLFNLSSAVLIHRSILNIWISFRLTIILQRNNNSENLSCAIDGQNFTKAQTHNSRQWQTRRYHNNFMDLLTEAFRQIYSSVSRKPMFAGQPSVRFSGYRKRRFQTIWLVGNPFSRRPRRF